jgi:hypothetical protein
LGALIGQLGEVAAELDDIAVALFDADQYPLAGQRLAPPLWYASRKSGRGRRLLVVSA